MQLYANNIQDKYGNGIAGASVLITLAAGGALPTLYSDNGITPTANPIIADDEGEVAFYAANGRYTLTATGAGIRTAIVRNFEMADGLEIVDAVTALAGGASADAAATAEDRTQTGLDRIAVNADKLATLDAASAAEISAAAALDRSVDAALSEYNAGQSANSAAAAKLTTDRLYPGSFATDPLLRPDGTARQVGDEMYNSTLGLKKLWNGSVWQASDLNTANLAAGSGTTLIGFDATLNYTLGTLGAIIQDTVINIRMFPWLAKGDGVTDDTAAFQACINWLASRGTSGGEMRVPKPTSAYLVGALTIGATMGHLKIMGEGNPRLLLKAATNASMFTVHEDTQFSMECVSLNGNKVAQTGGTSHAIDLPQATGGTYKNGARLRACTLLSFQNDGLHVGAYRSFGHISQTLIESCATALYMRAVDWEFNDVQFGNSTGHNIDISGNHDFVNCDVYGAGLQSPGVYTAKSGMLISGVSQLISFTNGMINGNGAYGVDIVGNGSITSSAINFVSTLFSTNGRAAANTYSNVRTANAYGVRFVAANFGYCFDDVAGEYKAYPKYHVEVISAIEPVILIGCNLDVAARTTSSYYNLQNICEISNSQIVLPQNFRNSPSIQAYHSTDTNEVLRSTNPTQANPRFILENRGMLRWGDGVSTVDTLMQRDVANNLKMGVGDSFQIDGAWNGGMLRLGVNWLWVDSTGKLRIKSTTPASDTDGTVVGTQT